MFKNFLVFLFCLQFSFLGFSQEEKKKFNFVSPSMISSYILIGAGATLIYAGGKEVLKVTRGAHSEPLAKIIFGGVGATVGLVGVGSFAFGGVIGFAEIAKQLLDLKDQKPNAYEKLLNEYEDIVVESEIVSFDKDLSFQGAIARELMTGLKQSNEIDDKDYGQKLSLVIKGLDDLAYKIASTRLDTKNVSDQISKISNGVISTEHAQRLVALRVSSLQ